MEQFGIPEGSVWIDRERSDVFAFVQCITDTGIVTYTVFDSTSQTWDRYIRHHVDSFTANYSSLNRYERAGH